MYKIRTLYISVHITTYPYAVPISCHLFLSRNLFYIDALHGINTTLTKIREGIKTPLITNFTMLFVPCMSTSWFNTMHTLICVLVMTTTIIRNDGGRGGGRGIYLVMHSSYMLHPPSTHSLFMSHFPVCVK